MTESVPHRNFNQSWFADDAAVLSESIPDLNVKIELIRSWLTSHGMRLNVKKSKHMAIGTCSHD